MASPSQSHIPFFESIAAFFDVYRIGTPLYPDIMCMRLEDQSADKLTYMPLFRANFFKIVLFTNSSIRFIYEEDKVDTAQNCLYFAHPGRLESWVRTGTTHGYVIYFTPDFAELDVTNMEFDHDYPYFSFDAELLLPLTKEETSELGHMMEQMCKEINSREVDNLEMLRKILHVYLHTVRRIHYKKARGLSVEARAGKALLKRYLGSIDLYMQQLASDQKNAMPSVTMLAQELHVHANYLNGVVKQLTGKTASSFIQDKLMLEAKSYLMHTNLQVAEIAFKLGFDNSPYFNRFFKKNAEITPMAFRKKFTEE